MKVILETDRLLLREYVEDDAESFFKLNTYPEVVRFVPDKPLVNVEQARQTLIDHPIADYRRYGFGRGACILKSTGEQIGFAGLKYLDELGEVDLAYRLLPAHWVRAWPSGPGHRGRARLSPLRFRRSRPETDHRPGHAKEHLLSTGLGKNRAALQWNRNALGTYVFKICHQPMRSGSVWF